MTGGGELRRRRYDVFISYDSTNEQWAAMLADGLKQRGYSVWWDRSLVQGDWADQLETKVRSGRVVVALVTERFVTRDWCRRECEIAAEAGTLMRVQTDPENTYAFADEALETACAKLQTIWSDPREPGFVAHIVEKLGIEPGGAKADRVKKPDGFRIELGQIPDAPPALVGRRAELDMLREAWDNRETNVAVLHALGGAGKSALLSTFVEALLADGGAGATRIYGWSAYSQGSGQDKNTSSDAFITAALEWFGGDPSAYSDPVAQARALGDLLAGERALLLLDGIEPLQNPPLVDGGRLKDKALAALLKKLARVKGGMVVITSRQELPELASARAVLNHKLDRLTAPAGAELLVELGVAGRQRELEAAVEEVHGHALSVTLLGTYLDSVAAGDVARRVEFKWDEIEPGDLSAPDEDDTDALAKRAEKVMRGYLEQLDRLGETAGGGAPERALLSLLGLFDRPADGPAIRTLLAGPAIPGLTDTLFVSFGLGEDGLTETALDNRTTAQRWRRAKERLRALRLLSPVDPSDPDGLDAHPIVRRYFRKRLEQTEPDAWRDANDRLYRHFSEAAPELPDTLEEMQPLFHAIGHGVAAGRVLEAFSEVYFARVRRPHQESFIASMLGAFGADLAALAPFFVAPWAEPRPELSDARGADGAALGYAAFALRGLGRLADAAAPMQAGLEREVVRKNWKNAAIADGNLSQLLLTIGQVGEARAAGAEAVAHADRSGDASELMVARTTEADAAHQAGDFDAALELFETAERMQAELQPDLPKLYSLQGFQYCDLLLSQGQAAEALERGRWMNEQAGRRLSDRLSLAVHELCIGRAHAALARTASAATGWLDRILGRRAAPATADPEHAAAARRHLNDAVAALRAAGAEEFVVRGLLARAKFLREQFPVTGAAEDRKRADEDLEEAKEIADYGGMLLFQCDIALERARWAVIDRDRNAAKPFVARARELVDECGYGRRKAAVAELERLVG